MLSSRKFLMALVIGSALGLARTRAQPPAAPPAARPGGNVQVPHFKDTPTGRLLDAVFTGSNSTRLPDGAVQVKGFKMIGVRDGHATNIVVTALAPECQIASNYNRLSDPGPVQIFTPTTNLFVQGVGFFCAESNQVLLISNQVETRVAKAMLKSPLFASASNTPAEAGQIVKILAERGPAQFDFRSNLVEYAGGVRVIDPQYQMDSPLLSIQFSSNQTVETMFARDPVTLTLTGRGVATGATAHYFATNENTLLELAGDANAEAHWQNGEQEAGAARFTYDPNRHLLTGSDNVRLRWPNPSTNPSAPQTFRKLVHADEAALQMTPDGREVDGLTAAGNVILVNQADLSRATAGKAVYGRTGDSIILTEDAVWWNEQMEVRGDTLSTAVSNSVYHAQGHARLKLHVSGAGGGLSGSPDQWLQVASDDAVSEPAGPETNRTTFRGHVRARLMDGDQLKDTLTAETLLVFQNSSRQLERVVAQGDVHAETAPDAAGVKNTISCGVLTAHCSPATGLWQDVVARENVVLESFGGPAAAYNRLTALTVTAHFSPVTNLLENAVAVGAVDFTQTAPGKSLHATGGQAVYTAGPDGQVELTGHPWAQTDKLTILNADRLKYDVKSGAVDAFGLYHIAPKRVATNGAQPAQPPP